MPRLSGQGGRSFPRVAQPTLSVPSPPAVTVDADAELSWTEFEVPIVDRDAEISWTEFEVPVKDADAELSWTEFEVPFADARANVSWAEFEVPSTGAGPTGASIYRVMDRMPAMRPIALRGP